MKHIFDVELAKSYGMDVAVFLENLSFWIINNQANKEHFHDGRYWTYNTLDAFTTIFPYLTKKQIRRVIDKCINNGLIVKGNYNQIGYDRTTWYSLSDKCHSFFELSLCPNGKIDVPKRANRNGQKGTPIPDINTDINTDIKDKKAKPKKQVSFDPCLVSLPDFLNEEIWKEFVQHRKDMKKPMTELASKKILNQLEKMKSEGQDIELVLNNSIANGWQGIFYHKPKGEVKYEKSITNGSGKSDWQIDHFKRVLGDEFPFFGLQSSGQLENIVPQQNEHDLQGRRRLESSSDSLDNSFAGFEPGVYLQGS